MSAVDAIACTGLERNLKLIECRMSAIFNCRFEFAGIITQFNGPLRLRNQVKHLLPLPLRL